ncbi:MAG: ribosomal RNA small subunit methyltransferase A [Treponema sp.]|nr:ribosomal RNA small subunit methyltransferase A [Treponema sp.]
MNHPDYNSPAELKAFMESNGMAMQKKFGQNFLVNEQARIKIVDSLDINENSTVWEVGPGLGSMTSEILKRGANLTVFEIDRGFIRFLHSFFEDYEKKGKFRVIEGDVLKTWKTVYEKDGQPDRFFGNLPYNIAATLIADTIENDVRFEKAVFTVQKEVALRACAKAGSEDYSSFSILCQWAYNLSPLMDLAGGNFWPKPNVDSRAFQMLKKEEFPCCKNPQFFMKVQRALFSSRRKNVRNNLSNFIRNSDTTLLALEKSGIDPMVRAEALPIEKILLLSDVLTDILK